jgi:hypothetical protein
MTFKVGDTVRVAPKGLSNVKEAARLTAKVVKDVGSDIYAIEFDQLLPMTITCTRPRGTPTPATTKSTRSRR